MKYIKLDLFTVVVLTVIWVIAKYVMEVPVP